MPTKTSPPAFIEDNADEIEAAFYDALRKADLDALMACWSDDEEVFCVHPGGPRLVGSAAIRAAFESMFGRGAIHAVPARKRKVQSMASEVHTVLERIEVMTPTGANHAFVLATNVFHRTPEGWRLVAHHASAGTLEPPEDFEESPHLLH